MVLEKICAKVKHNSRIRNAWLEAHDLDLAKLMCIMQPT